MRRLRHINLRGLRLAGCTGGQLDDELQQHVARHLLSGAFDLLGGIAATAYQEQMQKMRDASEAAFADLRKGSERMAEEFGKAYVQAAGRFGA